MFPFSWVLKGTLWIIFVKCRPSYRDSFSVNLFNWTYYWRFWSESSGLTVHCLMMSMWQSLVHYSSIGRTHTHTTAEPFSGMNILITVMSKDTLHSAFSCNVSAVIWCPLWMSVLLDSLLLMLYRLRLGLLLGSSKCRFTFTASISSLSMFFFWLDINKCTDPRRLVSNAAMNYICARVHKWGLTYQSWQTQR